MPVHLIKSVQPAKLCCISCASGCELGLVAKAFSVCTSSCRYSAAATHNAFSVIQAPDGEVFHSYAKAQEYWEEQGEVPLRQPFSDAQKPYRRLAGLPLGWEIQATHRDVGKRQGQVLF